MKFSQFPQQVIDENVDYTVKEITNIIKKYGPRESGNSNCLAAEKHIKKEMDPFCDETHFESYKMAPKAFLHFTKIVSVAIILAVVVCAALVFTSVLPWWSISTSAPIRCPLFANALEQAPYQTHSIPTTPPTCP